MAKLQNKLTEMESFIRERLSNPAPAQPQRTEPSLDEMRQRFLTDPVGFQLEMKQQMKAEVDNQLRQIIEKELPSRLTQMREKERFEAGMQEALELLFPKERSESSETIETRLTKDPERTERILQILDDYGLRQVSETDPKKAANAALKIYAFEQAQSNRNGKPNSLAPTKGQLAPVTSASPIGGGRKMPTPNEIVGEFQKMQMQLGDNPAYLHNKEFMDKFNLLRTQSVELLKQQTQ